MSRAPSNKQLVIIAFVISLLCLIPIPGGTLPLNHALLQAIPTPIGLLLLLIPFTIHAGLVVAHNVKVNDRIREQIASRKSRTQGRLVMQSRFRTTPEGTSWEIVNKNPFPWTKATLLIEKDLHGERRTEKHPIGTLHGKESIRIDSDLTPAETAQWRIMAVTAQGKIVDYPDAWERSELELVKTL